MILRRLVFSLIPLLLTLPLKAADEKLALPDLTGTLHEPLPTGGKSAALVVFVSPYCPTANTLMPEINRIMNEHAGKISSHLVHADADVKEADVQQHLELYKVKCPVLLDRKQELAKRLQAKITPEAVLLGPNGKVLYQGRINDLYLKPTRKQRQPTTHDLQDAITAVLAGEAVKIPRTEAVGCKISGLE